MPWFAHSKLSEKRSRSGKGTWSGIDFSGNGLNMSAKPDYVVSKLTRPTGGAATGGFVINLTSSTTPMALSQPKDPTLAQFTFFVSRRLEDGRERFRLHMGYFETVQAAEEMLVVVRDVYPGAWASEAPGKKLRGGKPPARQHRRRLQSQSLPRLLRPLRCVPPRRPRQRQRPRRRLLRRQLHRLLQRLRSRHPFDATPPPPSSSTKPNRSRSCSRTNPSSNRPTFPSCSRPRNR